MKCSYDKWIAKVDRIMFRKIGLAHDDVMDYNWYDLWESDHSPTAAVEEWSQDDVYGMKALF